MKKVVYLSLLSIITSILLLTQGPAKAESVQYEDVTKDDPAFGYAYDYIYNLTNKGIIHGYNEDGHELFKPGDDLTRTQAAIMLVKALGKQPLPDDTVSHFPDIKQGDFAYGYIQQAYELGIFHGHSNGNFGANEKLTRLQMAYTLVNTFKLTPIDKLPSQFKDINQTSIGYDYINALYYYGISDGSNGLYMPNSNIKRAQFSVFVVRGMDASYRVARTNAVAKGKVEVSAGSTLNIRQNPVPNSPVIGTLENQTTLDIYNQIGDWYQIKFNNAWAYVSIDYINVIPPFDPNKPLTGHIIVLDPGHGGSDPGSLALDGTEEQAVNYKFATSAMNVLQSAGATVIMSHQNDTNCRPVPSGEKFDVHLELQCRIDVATNNHADVFISIHSNNTDGEPTTANGTQTHYNDFNDPYNPGVNDFPSESKQLATITQSIIPSAIGMNSRKVIDDNLYVTRMNTVPAILIELGFLNNQADLNRLKNTTTQASFGKALNNVLVQYFKNVNAVPTPTATATSTPTNSVQ